MSFRKFGQNDIFINTLNSNPRSEFYIYSSSVYYNNVNRQQGQFSGHVLMTDTGFVNLYEYNIDKSSSINTYIYPYLSKDSTRVSLHQTFSELTTEDWGTLFSYGDRLSGSYPQFASIS